MEAGMILYQICVEGRYQAFDGRGKFVSKKVYLSPPSQREIEDFMDRCCNTKPPNNLLDLDRSTAKVVVFELIVSE